MAAPDPRHVRLYYPLDGVNKTAAVADLRTMRRDADGGDYRTMRLAPDVLNARPYHQMTRRYTGGPRPGNLAFYFGTINGANPIQNILQIVASEDGSHSAPSTDNSAGGDGIGGTPRAPSGVAVGEVWWPNMGGGGPTGPWYIQARKCTDGTYSGLWMEWGASGFSHVFKQGGACYYFDYLRDPLTLTPGTIADPDISFVDGGCFGDPCDATATCGNCGEVQSSTVDLEFEAVTVCPDCVSHSTGSLDRSWRITSVSLPSSYSNAVHPGSWPAGDCTNCSWTAPLGNFAWDEWFATSCSGAADDSVAGNPLTCLVKKTAANTVTVTLYYITSDSSGGDSMLTAWIFFHGTVTVPSGACAGFTTDWIDNQISSGECGAEEVDIIAYLADCDDAASDLVNTITVDSGKSFTMAHGGRIRVTFH